MALAATRCGGNRNLLHRNFGLFKFDSNGNDRPVSLTIRNDAKRKSGKKSTMTIEKSRSIHPLDLENGWNRSGSDMGSVACEKLDEWMRDSVVEIVKYLREAPLIVHVYNKGRNDGVETEMVMEKTASAGDWAVAKGKWETGDAPSPEGLIFVEELGHGSNESEKEVTREWGVVLQGKGPKCPPACYLLKTSSVGSGSGCGLGLGCTHFCLVRVNSFRETAETQLRNCWL
ncbi:uncharacterized protein LOC115699425 [Cannabis sativa]|uniref:DUF7804 domain-containing protein n=1 Tax=Cannabis sativa TaxID=3483 RepID=A0A7J6F168_CANSA|nr:uncharacterized protein LOC115699425 [Cannabis sativa]KAF4364453.1 hypothetical protein F8388_007030 [Cannabis sativa]KAF4384876.1 hypothetical protein G4B88_000272 [Cannabis sativa]